MNYEQAVSYVLDFADYEKMPGIIYTAANYDLRRMDRLLQLLDDPHVGAKIVHIAGTKGKGSTAAMVSSVLTAAGYRTGLYTSPHFHTIRERMRIDGVFIPEEEFASLVTQIQPLIEEVNREAAFGLLTTFEILTVVAFAYFRKNRVDFQVLEVGLGGRLDATNVVKPDVCVITSISLDHTGVLGDTLAKIAAEKSGIIKQGSVVVNFPQADEAMRIIREACNRQGARLIQVGEDVIWRRTGGDVRSQSLVVKTQQHRYDVTIPLIGDFQLENTSAAIAALEVLAQQNTMITARAITEGLRQVQWPGRFHLLKQHPMVIADGAHNTYSMQRLIESIKKYLRYNDCHVIFGTSSDKDIAGMVKALAAFSHNITVTSSSHPRAASSSVIAEEFARHGIHVILAKDVAGALEQALTAAQKSDCILVTGSLFIVGETLKYFDVQVSSAS